MRVLRIGTSNDEAGLVPEESRSWKVAERMLSESIGEPVETVLKRAWPNAQLGELVQRWMAELQPDFVVIQVNNYWYGHESLPLWIERRFGRPGVSVGRAGGKLGRKTGLADNRWAQLVNRKLVALLPHATHFTISEVTSSMEMAIRKVIAHEGAVVLIRGNEDWVSMPMASRGFNRRNRARNAAMSAAMKAVCERLRVPYAQRPPVGAGELKTVNGAGFHNTAEAEREIGVFDGRAMVEAWAGARVASS